MKQIWTGGLLEGQTSVLPGGYKVSFTRVLRYTTLQVTNAPGLPIIYGSFVLMLGGLLVRLYLRPALEWRARAAVARSTVERPTPAADPQVPAGPAKSPAGNPTG
jgi:cytochrome c biogenesis protein ResB